MGSNRAVPFGFKMEFGRIVIFPEEASRVTYLFDQYLLGASYKGLSDEMNGYGVHYDGEKPWNKNMIARILQDCRHTGEGGAPKIIEPSVYQHSEEKRKKSYGTRKIRGTESPAAQMRLSNHSTHGT